MAQKARAQNEDLSARLEALEAAAAKKAPKSKAAPKS
jgi:BMFP domain-containing protein YqiC